MAVSVCTISISPEMHLFLHVKASGIFFCLYFLFQWLALAVFLQRCFSAFLSALPKSMHQCIKQDISFFFWLNKDPSNFDGWCKPEAYEGSADPLCYAAVTVLQQPTPRGRVEVGCWGRAPLNPHVQPVFAAVIYLNFFVHESVNICQANCQLR